MADLPVVESQSPLLMTTSLLFNLCALEPVSHVVHNQHGGGVEACGKMLLQNILSGNETSKLVLINGNCLLPRVSLVLHGYFKKFKPLI